MERIRIMIRRKRLQKGKKKEVEKTKRQIRTKFMLKIRLRKGEEKGREGFKQLTETRKAKHK